MRIKFIGSYLIIIGSIWVPRGIHLGPTIVALRVWGLLAEGLNLDKVLEAN